MIQPGTAYLIPFETTIAGVATAADSLPTAVLWRNGAAELTPVSVAATANPGIYHATFTADAGWDATDRLWIIVSTTLATLSYTRTVWSSFSEPQSAVSIGAAVWDAVVATMNTAGTAGRALARLIGLIEDVSGDRLTAKALEVVLSHGDETWADAGELAQDVIFHATTMSGLTAIPVNGVQISVAGRTRFTGTDGMVTLRLNAGDYTLSVIEPPGYDYVAAIEFNVPDVPVDAVEVDVLLSPVATEVPTGAPVCMCTIIAIDQHGDPAVAASVTAVTRSTSISDGELFVFNVERPFTTDDRGYVVLPLLREQRYDITVEYGDFGTTTVKRTIPDASTYRITVQL